MSGNIGSERRLEYTAIGDTVNTANRIEAMTKELARPVLVDGRTRSLLTRPADDLVYVDEFGVRGRQARISLWTLANGAGG